VFGTAFSVIAPKKMWQTFSGILVVYMLGMLFSPAVIAADKTAPATPAGFQAYPGNTRAYMAWKPGSETDIAGYNVYCSTKSTVLGKRINTGLVPKQYSYLTHFSLKNGNTYYYRVKAVDTSGNESKPSVALAVKPAKTAVQKLSGMIKGKVALKSNTVYIVTGSLTVDSSALLAVEPGVIVKFNAGKNFFVKGILRAKGIPNYPAYFSSIKDDSAGGDSNGDGSATKPAAKNWSGLRMSAGSSVELAGTVIRYGNQGIYYYAPKGYYYDSSYFIKKLSIISSEISNCYHGVYILGARDAYVRSNTIHDNSAFGIMVVHCDKPVIRDNKIQNNGTSGVNSKAVEIDPKALPNFIGNTISGNIQNGVWIWDAAQKPTDPPSRFSLTGLNSTLFGNTIYILYGTSWVSPKTTFTIQPGSVVKGQAGGLVVRGRLLAQGTQSNPITFTSYRDSSLGGNTYGSQSKPYSSDWAGIRFEQGSSGTLAGVRIKHASTGISADKAGVSITNSVFDKNSSAASNTSGSQAVSAANNWWGAADGPRPYGNGNSVSGNIVVTPWLTSSPF
jgi:parallel beta-helix repeat protein